MSDEAHLVGLTLRLSTAVWHSYQVYAQREQEYQKRAYEHVGYGTEHPPQLPVSILPQYSTIWRWSFSGPPSLRMTITSTLASWDVSEPPPPPRKQKKMPSTSKHDCNRVPNMNAIELTEFFSLLWPMTSVRTPTQLGIETHFVQIPSLESIPNSSVLPSCLLQHQQETHATHTTIAAKRQLTSPSQKTTQNKTRSLFT
ncbi:unnamed protein product [Ectocarpus sp. 12 AP-2014]